MNPAKIFLTTAGIALFSSAALAVDCVEPEMPNVPDGDSATESQMDQASSEVEDFVTESKNYLGCVKDKQMNLAASATEDEREAISEMYDDMLDKIEDVTSDMQDAASDYKEQIADNMEAVDSATQDEQDTVANMYDDMVENLKTASAETRQAFNDFREDMQDDMEEAE